MERISDLAVSIAGSALHAADSTETESFELPDMIEKVLSMLNKSIHALINLDPQIQIHPLLSIHFVFIEDIQNLLTNSPLEQPALWF